MRSLRVLAFAAVLLAVSSEVDSARFEFTHAPAAFADISRIEPLGGLNPGDNHVLAVDHMYLGYPVPPGPPINAYSVYAMGVGSIVMVVRLPSDDVPDPDYGIYIQHTRSITSYVLHLHALSANIDGIVATAPESAWVHFGALDILLLGQLGAPAPIPVSGGDFLGFTKNYSHNWDVGVIDSKVRGDFIGRGERRYPKIADYLALLGVAADPPHSGQQTLNAVCFTDYLEPGLRASYELLLTGPNCGRAGWDVAGALRGAWFNPALDAAVVPPLGEIETGALSIIPDNQDPAYVRIAFGAGSSFSAFDPDPARPVTQLRQAFRVAVDATAGALINPDPQAVGVRTGPVCYDLPYAAPEGPRFNSVRFYLPDRRSLQIRYDPTPHVTPQCAGFIDPPDATWVVYVR